MPYKMIPCNHHLAPVVNAPCFRLDEPMTRQEARAEARAVWSGERYSDRLVLFRNRLYAAMLEADDTLVMGSFGRRLGYQRHWTFRG